MIDLMRGLADCELRAKKKAMDTESMVFRLAMRYLALRDDGVAIEVNSLDRACWLFSEELDAAADRLIQEMLK